MAGPAGQMMTRSFSKPAAFGYGKSNIAGARGADDRGEREKRLIFKMFGWWARDSDRTCDPYHVRVQAFATISLNLYRFAFPLPPEMRIASAGWRRFEVHARLPTGTLKDEV
jgi:hypothetical protein